MEFTPIHALLWIVGAFATLMTFTLALVVVRPTAQDDLVSLGLTSSAALVLVAAQLLSKSQAGSSVLSSLGLRKTHPWAVFLAAVLGVLSQVPAGMLEKWVDHIAPLSVQQTDRGWALLQSDSPLSFLMLGLVLVFVVPLSEEVFFRGAVYGALRRGSNSLSVSTAVVAIGFALFHFNVRQLLPLLFISLVFGLLRASSGSLLPSLAAHIAFNGVAMGEAYIDKRYSSGMLSNHMEWGVTLCTVLALGVFAFLVHVHPRARQSRMQETLVSPSYDGGHGGIE